MKQLSLLLFLVLSVTSLTGCASIVSDNDSTTYIQTMPEKARCTLHGQDFKRVVETPDSVHLPAEAAPIVVSCESEGYRTASATLDTEMDGWILGNIIFGGVVGAVIDASRGAGMEYPPQFMVSLDPIAFDTIAKRDEYYDAKISAATELYDRQINKAERRWTSEADQSRLERIIAKLEEDKSAEIKRLEENRVASVVRTSTVAPPELSDIEEDRAELNQQEVPTTN